MNAEQLLHTHWGYSTFRPLQKEIIETIASGRDTFALLTTGGGKSICYQIPGMLLGGTTIVISPLISLMKDQVDGLKKRNIPATYLATDIDESELNKRHRDIRENKYAFVYVSPERLQNNSFISLIQSIPVPLIVVDESHCVSLWGAEFRPSYRKIYTIIEQLTPRPIVSAFTATATPRTQQDILQSLHLQNPALYQSSFKRNIEIAIIPTASITEHDLQLLSFLKNCSEPGIIYTSSRSETERISARLNSLAHLLDIRTVGCYHAGLPTEHRQKTQQLFLENKLQLLVATTAFGMGIDKPNITWVVHYHPPATLEGYYQEIGRAGRNGQVAQAVFFFCPEHLRINKSLIDKKSNNSLYSAQLFRDVYTFITSKKCRMQSIVSYFGEGSEPCGVCDQCTVVLSPLKRVLTEQATFLNQLDMWRRAIAQEKKIEPHYILTTQQALYLALLHPIREQEFSLLPGFGTGWRKLLAENLLNQRWYNTGVHNLDEL